MAAPEYMNDLRLALVWPSFTTSVAYEYVHVICACARFYHAFLRRCFHNKVLLKQSAIEDCFWADM